MLTLNEVKKDSKCKIESIEVQGKLLKKFLDMGFVKGVDIEVIRVAPLCDPMELKVHNYYVSIRKKEAKSIRVKLT